MPYANNTAFARQMRAYLADKKRRLAPRSLRQYQKWLTNAGERLEWKDPKDVRVKDLEDLEAELMGEYAESTVAGELAILRELLKWAGNKEVHRFKSLCSMQPARDSVFLSEEQIAVIRLRARQLSNTHELVYSLMVDNGLRPVADILRLTVSNARELVDTGEAMITGKGRNGGKVAKLVMSPLTRAPLLKYLAQRRTIPEAEHIEQLIVCTFHGKLKGATRTYISNLVNDIKRESGLEFKPRDLRKTCGNRVYKETRDVAMAAMILRHSNPGTTFRHYIGADSVEMKDVQARLAGRSLEVSSKTD